MQTGEVTNFNVFAKVSTKVEPLFVPFYTSLNADISGTRKDIKNWSTAFFPLSPVFSGQKIKIFISYPP